MSRHWILTLGLVALVLTFGPRVAAMAAAEPAKAAAPDRSGRDSRGNRKIALTEPAEAGAPATHPQPAEAAAEHGHGGGGEPDILEPQPTLALWTVVVFVGLLLVLGKFAWKPLLNALEQREEHLEHCLLETERARNESEQLLAQHRQQLAAAADQVRALLDEARRESQALKDDFLQQARAEADAERQRAQRDIESARDAALHEIWSKTADLAVAVAGKVLSRELGPEDHQRLVASAIGELPANPALSGGAGSPTA